jgi:hypothetical protein
MRRVAVLFALTGCSSIFGLHEPTHGTVVDAAASDSSDAPDGRMPDASMCVGHGALAVCFDALPTMSTQLPPSITTSDDAQCSTTAHWVDSTQPSACFIAGTDIVQSGTTVVDGTRPLVLVALGSLEVAGSIDASSHVGVTAAGPGADPATCLAFAGAAQPNPNGGGGGAGGSFISQGGNGGAGDSGITQGGQPAPAIAASPALRGGCAGQVGASGGGSGASTPGHGGGAVYLLAGTQLVFQAGRVAANGAGASAPQNRFGGSGGGAGGMIVLDAPAIMMTNAFLTANGGGGASGTDGGVGNPGSDPNPLDPLIAAPGGAGTRGGPGGAGAAGTMAAADGGFSGGGNIHSGGGGGGGIGVIYAPTTLVGATVSPAVTPLP